MNLWLWKLTRLDEPEGESSSSFFFFFLKRHAGGFCTGGKPSCQQLLHTLKTNKDDAKKMCSYTNVYNEKLKKRKEIQAAFSPSADSSLFLRQVPGGLVSRKLPSRPQEPGEGFWQWRRSPPSSLPVAIDKLSVAQVHAHVRTIIRRFLTRVGAH